ncbi:MAG: asparaginase [Pseudomonadota bacterium]
MTETAIRPENPILATRSRNGFVERTHTGRIAIIDGRAGPEGALLFAAGDVETPFLPRSSCKILQAMPLVESGAADAARLTPQRLALACASHQGSHRHAALAEKWLAEMDLSAADLMCGPQVPNDRETRAALRLAGDEPSQLHNNCSGKHTGFLCQARHLGAHTDGYIDNDHAVQRAVADATAELAGEVPAGFAIDGCSAPNYAVSPHGMARAMARIAAAETALDGSRRAAAIRLREAMALNPFEVAGDGRCCTELMTVGRGRFVIKTGAEGSFTGIIPERGLGIMVKIDDGNTAAAESVMAGLLVALGELNGDDPKVTKWLTPSEVNRRGIVCGSGAPAEIVTNVTLS